MLLLILNCVLHVVVCWAEAWTNGNFEVEFEWISKRWTAFELLIEGLIVAWVFSW